MLKEISDIKTHLALQESVQGRRCPQCEMKTMEIRQLLEGTELQKARREAAKCKNEYESFKKRMALDLSSDLHHCGGQSENIMDPCRESQLINMYERITCQVWGKTQEKILGIGTDHQKHYDVARILIEEMFEMARKEMAEKTEVVKQLFMYNNEDPPEAGSASKKVSELVHSALHELQLALYYCDRHKYEEKVTEYLTSPECRVMPGCTQLYTELLADCYRMACLFALHDPPLKPIWKYESREASASSHRIKQYLLFPAIYRGKIVLTEPVFVTMTS
ncbi:hypothetical protein GN956_G22244 [Arapaima gigas]